MLILIPGFGRCRVTIRPDDVVVVEVPDEEAGSMLATLWPDGTMRVSLGLAGRGDELRTACAAVGVLS